MRPNVVGCTSRCMLPGVAPCCVSCWCGFTTHGSNHCILFMWVLSSTALSQLPVVVLR